MVRKANDVTALVEEFAQSVAAQTEAMWRGDHRAGNKHAKRYITAIRKIREVGDSGREALAVLLAHERRDVRVMAAAYLLRYRTNDVLAVLRDVAGGEGLAAFEASQAIKRWEEGTWALDPPDGQG